MNEATRLPGVTRRGLPTVTGKPILTNIHDEPDHSTHGEARIADGHRIEAAADEIFSRANEAVLGVAGQAMHMAQQTLKRGRAGVRKAGPAGVGIWVGGRARQNIALHHRAGGRRHGLCHRHPDPGSHAEASHPLEKGRQRRPSHRRRDLYPSSSPIARTAACHLRRSQLRESFGTGPSINGRSATGRTATRSSFGSRSKGRSMAK